MSDTEPTYRLTIRDLPAQERPREKLARHGAGALSTQELLAIILRTGTARCSALSLADRLIHAHGGLRGLARAEIADLAKTPGVGTVKAVQIAACVELGKRLATYPEENRLQVSGPETIADLLIPEMRDLKVEQFRVVVLDAQHQIMRIRTVSVGSVTASIVHPREVLREAIIAAGAFIVAVHNHPSGDPTPSRDDEDVTRRLAQAAKLMGIPLLDHIVLGDRRWVSLRSVMSSWPG